MESRALGSDGWKNEEIEWEKWIEDLHGVLVRLVSITTRPHLTSTARVADPFKKQSTDRLILEF